jgi:hypothetical protein
MIDTEPQSVSDNDPGVEFAALVVHHLAGELSSSQREQLNAQLTESAERRDEFVAICVQSRLMATRIDMEVPLKEDSGGAVLDEQSASKPAHHNVPLSSLHFPSLSITLHGTVGYLSSDWPVAYLVATVIFAIGALIGSFVTVSHSTQSTQVAQQPSPSGLPVAEPKMEFVGRITDMVDCMWADPKTETISGARVSLGREYALKSGLMEISYDTGAKVILQGPVTYEVESGSSGYLAIGKLTARVEKKVASGQRSVAGKSEMSSLATSHKPLATSSNPQSLIPNPSLSTLHSPLFTIKTPAATVTDLGTEFGVEVDRQGRTVSRVFHGLVKVQILDDRGRSKGAGQLLRENESVQVAGEEGERRIVVIPSAKSSSFIREIPKRTIKVIDLVDIVTGCDGVSKRHNRGIDPTSGQSASVMSMDYLSGDGQYHPVGGLAYVDGVFIPDGRRGAVQTDSAGHTFASFSPTANRTIGSVWAFAGPLTFSPPSARSKLAIKASESFTYKYEMDYVPSDVSHIDLDRNGVQDFAAFDRSSVANGVLTLTDASLISCNPAMVWPGKFSFSRGYTIEARVKVASSSGLGPFALFAALPRKEAGFSTWLNVGDDMLTWGNPDGISAEFYCNTTDDYHVYRVAQEAGTDTYSLWRDGGLLSNSLSNGLNGGGLDQMGFGKLSNSCGGTALVDYVRFTSGAYAPVPSAELGVAARAETFETVPTKLGDVDYAWPGHGGLFLHANKAITFDLQAIRQANRYCKLLRFRAVAGNTETVSEKGAAVLTDVWVLVDGQPRFRRREICGLNGAFPINIPLGENDRFLTLAATDGGNDIRGDWILFGDPQLDLMPIDSASQKGTILSSN